MTVVENPVINQIAFEGNSEIDTETLRNEVQLKPRAVFTRARVQADVQRILDVYQRQGRYAATVDPKIIELEQDRVNLVFEIAEGSATKVKGIHFVGNQAFTDSQLRDVISTTEKGWFDFLKGTSVYDPDRMNLDRELLRQYYLKNGYADVQVTAANAELDRDGSGFFITYAIEEGEPYDFGAVTIESTMAEVEPDDLPRRALDQGGRYLRRLPHRQVGRGSHRSPSPQKGYAFARVRPKAEADPVTRKIALDYVIEEGPRVYIERINIIGNTRTKDYVIRREFKVAEGDAYNPLMVDQAKKRLKNLGIFKNVEVKRRPGSAQDRVILDVEVVEQSTGELSFGAGYSTSEGVIGDVSITERNLMGNGQFLRLALSGSLERLQVDLSFTEPRFLDRNLAAGFDLFHKEIDQTSPIGLREPADGRRRAARLPAVREAVDADQLHGVARRDLRRAAWRLARHPGGRGQSPSPRSSERALTYDLRNDPKNPTKGLLLPGRHGFCRSRRRRAVRQLRGRGARLLPDHRQDHLRQPRDRRQHQGWGGRTCASSTCSSRAARRCAASIAPATARATSTPTTRSAAPPTGRRRPRSASPSRSCPTISGSRAPCSRMPARCSAPAQARQQIQGCTTGDRTPRSALPTARPSAPRSARASCGPPRSAPSAWTSPRS